MRRMELIRTMMAAVTLTLLVPHLAWAQERVHEWGWSMHPETNLALEILR